MRRGDDLAGGRLTENFCQAQNRDDPAIDQIAQDQPWAD